MILTTLVIQQVSLKLLLSTSLRERPKLGLLNLLPLGEKAVANVEERMQLSLIEVDEEVMLQEVEGLLHLNSTRSEEAEEDNTSSHHSKSELMNSITTKEFNL